MHGALRWGKASSLDEARHVLVEVTLSDGSVGYAEAPPRPTIYGETVESIVAILRNELAPRIVGMPVLDPEPAPDPLQSAAARKIQARLHEIKNNHAAKGALDIAIHDAIAAHLGLSLADYLGATTARLKVSYILGIGDRATVLEEAVRVVEQGVRVLKVKVGRDWHDDLERIAELQSTLGPEVELYADANECLDANEATEVLPRLAEAGLLYCEEPIPVDIIPLIADDSAFTVRDLRREIAFDTFDILNIKTARTGYTESAAMVDLACARGKGIMVGSQASAGLGTARAALFAARPGIDHPSELSFFLKLKHDIVDRPLTLQDGYLSLAEAASLRVDPARLAEAARLEH
jgi:L-alanine-DL-glutamate epimerase-like enolase superfamily enzyme